LLTYRPNQLLVCNSPDNKNIWCILQVLTIAKDDITVLLLSSSGYDFLITMDVAIITRAELEAVVTQEIDSNIAWFDTKMRATYISRVNWDNFLLEQGFDE